MLLVNSIQRQFLGVCNCGPILRFCRTEINNSVGLHRFVKCHRQNMCVCSKLWNLWICYVMVIKVADGIKFSIQFIL